VINSNTIFGSLEMKSIEALLDKIESCSLLNCFPKEWEINDVIEFMYDMFMRALPKINDTIDYEPSFVVGSSTHYYSKYDPPDTEHHDHC
jgi:hypothetical protein